MTVLNYAGKAQAESKSGLWDTIGEPEVQISISGLQEKSTPTLFLKIILGPTG